MLQVICVYIFITWNNIFRQKKSVIKRKKKYLKIERGQKSKNILLQLMCWNIFYGWKDSKNCNLHDNENFVFL